MREETDKYVQMKDAKTFIKFGELGLKWVKRDKRFNQHDKDLLRAMLIRVMSQAEQDLTRLEREGDSEG